MQIVSQQPPRLRVMRRRGSTHFFRRRRICPFCPPCQLRTAAKETSHGKSAIRGPRRRGVEETWATPFLRRCSRESLAPADFSGCPTFSSDFSGCPTFPRVQPGDSSASSGWCQQSLVPADFSGCPTFPSNSSSGGCPTVPRPTVPPTVPVWRRSGSPGPLEKAHTHFQGAGNCFVEFERRLRIG